MRENRLSGLMRGGKQTVIGSWAFQPVASRLLYTLSGSWRPCLPCLGRCPPNTPGRSTHDEPGRPAGGDRSRRPGSGKLPPHPGRGVHQDRLAGACLGSAGQSLSSGDRGPAGEAGGQDEMAARPLHRARPSPAWPGGTALWRATSRGLAPGASRKKFVKNFTKCLRRFLIPCFIAALRSKNRGRPVGRFDAPMATFDPSSALRSKPLPHFIE